MTESDVNVIMKTEYDIETIRKQIGYVAHNLYWLTSTGRLFPSNIPDFDEFRIQFNELLEITKIHHNGKLKKQDKRGYWR